MPEIVDTVDDARVLAERILAPRERPLVVVSTAFDSGDNDIDARWLEAELGAVADVVLLTTGESSRMVDQLLPDKLQVFGGAGRSYPVDIGRDPDIRRSPLRFPVPGATERLAKDAFAHAYAAGLLRPTPIVAPTASGRVLGVTAGRGLMSLDGGGMASIWHELTWPEVPLEWTIHAGMVMRGVVDATSGRFEVARPLVDEGVIEAAFPHRSVTLALVVSVSDAAATLALHPDVAVRITRPDVSPNERDALTLLLSEGDVVAVRVLHLSGGRIHLQLSDVDEDEPLLPALALLAGGDPWLYADRPLRAVEVVVPAPPEKPVHREQRATPEKSEEPERAHALDAAQALGPGPGTPENRGALRDTQLALSTAQQRIAKLEADLSDAGADESSHARLEQDARIQRRIATDVKIELAEAHREIAALKNSLSEVKRALRTSVRESNADPVPAPASRVDRRAAWTTEDDWLRHEIYLAWVERVGATDRASWPLPADYRMSERLAPSLAELDDGQFDKALKAIVDVLTGRVREIPSRELHALRVGVAGNAPAYVRHDGARCFRVYIEQKTPAARRLHFWHPQGGPLELERVVSHDVVEP